MELWIRSQDKEKLKIVKDISLSVAGGNIFCDKEILGEYKTRSRALEILDEIEGILLYKRLEKVSGDCIINVENNVAVYEMPKE